MPRDVCCKFFTPILRRAENQHRATCQNCLQTQLNDVVFVSLTETRFRFHNRTNGKMRQLKVTDKSRFSNLDRLGEVNVSEFLHSAVVHGVGYFDGFCEWHWSVVGVVEISFQPVRQQIQIWQSRAHSNNLHTTMEQIIPKSSLDVSTNCVCGYEASASRKNLSTRTDQRKQSHLTQPVEFSVVDALVRRKANLSEQQFQQVTCATCVEKRNLQCEG